MAPNAAPKRLTGRVLVVTAAAADVAIAAAREGATVVVADADAAAAGDIAARVRAAGGRATVFAGDVRAPRDRAALTEMLDELFGERATS